MTILLQIAWPPPLMCSRPAGEGILKPTFAQPAESSQGRPRNPLQEKTLALFDELREPLLRYALSLGVVPSRTEEIIQESFLKLFEHLRAGKSEENLRGWLFRVTHNLALRDLRERRCASGDSTLDPIAQSFEDPSPDPEQRLILDSRETVLFEALRKLPDIERRCLHLRAEGLRYREIASILNVGVSTVADHLRRAIGALQRELRA